MLRWPPSSLQKVAQLSSLPPQGDREVASRLPVSAQTGWHCGNHKASLPTLPQGPVQSLPVWGGIFYKIAFRLGSNYFLSNPLVCNRAGKKGKDHTPWEGSQHGSHGWVRAGVE